MSFKIRLNNISVPTGHQFKVFYKLDSRTPGNVTYQGDTSWGTLYGTYTGGTTTDIEIDFDLIDPTPFGKQHWFKILDIVTGSYIIENIYINEYEYYYYCDHCCDFSGGTASFVEFSITPTPTPEPTSTPTPTSITETTPTPTPTEIPGDPADCSEGMDVVFLVDYTGSMGGAINGIKSTITSIVNTIVTESNNNYRLGLVIYDEYGSGTVSTYSSHIGYTSLPSNQKYVNTGIGGRYQWITSLEKMSSNNQTSFTTQLNLLNNSFGGGWPIGSGLGGPEPADIGVNVIATNEVSGYEYIAGTFRSGVSKLIILITDNSPSGNDDNYTQTDIDYIATLTPKLVNQNIRVLLMTTYSTTALNTLAIDTNGLVNIGFTGANIITAIENICVPT